MKIEDLPEAECRVGFPDNQVHEIMGSRYDEFWKWMYGQTYAHCEGRAYNHDKREYEIACDGVSHGPVVYGGDVYRFLNNLPIVD